MNSHLIFALFLTFINLSHAMDQQPAAGSSSSSSSSSTPTTISSRMDHIRSLVEHDADVTAPIVSSNTANNNSPLHQAAREGNIDSIRSLVADRHPVDALNVWHMTPLTLAVRDGRTDREGRPHIAELLLSLGANPNVLTHDDDLPFALQHRNHIELIRHPEISLLHWAARRGHVHMLDLLLSLRYVRNAHSVININRQAANGQTALMMAAANNQADAVYRLIDAGADTNVMDIHNRMALTIARERDGLSQSPISPTQIILYPSHHSSSSSSRAPHLLSSRMETWINDYQQDQRITDANILTRVFPHTQANPDSQPQPILLPALIAIVYAYVRWQQPAPFVLPAPAAGPSLTSSTSCSGERCSIQ